MLKKGLAVAVILLFIGMCIVPSTAVQNFKEKPSPISFDGNTLYVGGTGPNNYTTIQGAIDDAVDGDTVFVYDDSSPYYENIDVNKEIDLFGENRYTTVIEGNGINSVIHLSADSVLINDFTITGGNFGIHIQTYHHVTIIGNIITGNSLGLFIEDSDNNFIVSNEITSNIQEGISIGAYSNKNNIGSNTITHNDIGIRQIGIVQFWRGNKEITNTLILMNEIANNNLGVDIGTNGNTLLYNNFKNNNNQASFTQCLHNDWDENYWDDYQESPYIIKGRIGFIFSFIPWRDYDNYPASEPFDF